MNAEPTIVAISAQAMVTEEPGISSQEQVTGDERWAVVAYAPGSTREEWCQVGHRGFVLEGTITYELTGNLKPLSASAGDGFVLPTGIAHRGRNDTQQLTRIFLIDDAFVRSASDT